MMLDSWSWGSGPEVVPGPASGRLVMRGPTRQIPAVTA
jgi:hypothetical protein